MVTIGKDGKATVETTGFSGVGCQAASAPYERALGVVTADMLKAEAFEAQATESATSSVQAG